MMHLGGHSAPRHKNVIFVQVLSTKKIMLALLKVFNILQLFSYSEQTYNENFFYLCHQTSSKQNNQY